MKAVFFLGRVHHGLKLMYLANELSRRGVNVEVLASDNAINIDPPGEFMRDSGIPEWNHVKDYIVPELVPDVDQITSELMPYTIDAALRGVPPFWTAYSIREAGENIMGMRNFLEMSQPAYVFALHENNFWVKMLFYIAQEMGIKTYSLMEGIILDREESDLGKYSIGTSYTDTLFSWSAEDARYYSDSKLIAPTGPPHMDEWMRLARLPMKHIQYRQMWRQGAGLGGKKVVTFAPPRLDLYQGDFFAHLEKLASWSLHSGVGFVLRLHPFQQGDFSPFIKKNPHVRLEGGSDGMPSVAGSDLVITQTSTIAIEAIAMGTPVVQIDLDFEGLEQPIECAEYWTDGDTGVLERILNGQYDVQAYDGFRKDR